MSAKPLTATVQELRDFIDEDWGPFVPKGTRAEDWYLEPQDPLGQGYEVLYRMDPADIVEVTEELLGVVSWQGSEGAEAPDPHSRTYPTTEKLFLAWRRTRTSKTFAVSVPHEGVEEFKKLAKKHNWKVGGA